MGVGQRGVVMHQFNHCFGVEVVCMTVQYHRVNAHERAVAVVVFIQASALQRGCATQMSFDGTSCGEADVTGFVGCGVCGILHPVSKAAHTVFVIDALRKTVHGCQCHGGVIRPSACGHIVCAVASHPRDGVRF